MIIWLRRDPQQLKQLVQMAPTFTLLMHHAAKFNGTCITWDRYLNNYTLAVVHTYLILQYLNMNNHICADKDIKVTPLTVFENA